MKREVSFLVDVVRSGRTEQDVLYEPLLKLGLYLCVPITARSHHLFSRPGVAERVNLQREGSHAKPYQVRQVRRILLKYELAGEE